MRITRCIILTLLVAATGCAGRGWTGQTIEEEENTVTARQVSSREKKSTPVAATNSLQRSTIAQVSHTEPVAPERAKPERTKKTTDRENETGFGKRYAQGRSLESANKLGEAREIYEQMISDYPRRWEPYHRLGLVADRQRRFTEAESLLSEALRRKPMDAEIFGDLGYCYYLQGKLDKAESALAKAVSIKPSEARYRNNLGLVYGAKGRNEEALECFRHAGSEADAQYNMAFVMATRNDMVGAKKRFQAALNADPNHDGARRALRSFEQAEREGDDAEPEMASDGRRWERYVEDANPATEQKVANSTATKALQTKARGMMRNKMEGGR